MQREIKKSVRHIGFGFLLGLYCILPVRTITLKQVFDYRPISDARVSPDGSRAVFVVHTTDLESNSRSSELWLIDLGTGKHFQLTRDEKLLRAPAWSPDGQKIAFLSNRKGPNQIWMISPGGDEAEHAADFGRVNIKQFRWLPKGNGFIFTAVRPQIPQTSYSLVPLLRERHPQAPILVDRNVTHYDLKPRINARMFQVKFGEERPKLLILQDCHILSFDISPDGNLVVFSSQPTSGRLYEKESDLKLLDMNSHTIRDLITQPGPDLNPKFSPDGQRVAYVHHEGGLTNWTLQLAESDSKCLRPVSSSFDENIMDYQWLSNNRHIVFAGSRGISRIAIRMDISTGLCEPIRALDGLHVCKSFSFSKDGRTGVAVISGAHSPEEVFVVHDSGRSKKILTRINRLFCEMAPITEVINYKSEDGLDLEGLILKPKSFEAGRRYPLLVIVHGGPALVFNCGFNPGRGAYPLFGFADQGYVVFLPNPRGSTGYGESFRSANYEDLGGKDFEDIMSGIDLLIEKGIADPDRMGLMGWSYGGFMAYWAVTHTDRFKAISAGAGLTNLISFYGTNDAEGAGIETYFGSLPWENSRLFLDHSPLQFIRNAKTPLLIQHGGNDLRVPLSQAQEFYFAAIKVGLPVEMVVYPRQGHSLWEPRMSMAAMEKNLHWFSKWLLAENIHEARLW
jgi:dipeptidyl aminopeptidase/acylaminoacyl peptidase